MILGTRPEAIKLEPVAAALRRRGLPLTLVFTGQHRQLDPADYGLHSYDCVRLNCPGQMDPHAHVGAVTRAAAAVLRQLRPTLTIVHGDTSSALGGALASRLAGVPVAHVEAGLRSHDCRRPWPEEEFRVAIDAEAELLFAPTELSAANLRREHVRGQMHVTGNTGIDAVLAKRPPSFGQRTDLPRMLVTCHRRENWDDGLERIADAVRAVAAEGIASVEMLLHTNGGLAGRVRAKLGGIAGVTLRPACSHAETLEAMVACDLVLSDSGGMQEEAAALGVPLLVLRDRTERPEAIATGSVELVGTDPARIFAAARRRLREPAATAALPFGDGRAGERIARIIEEWLGEKGAMSPRTTAVPRTACSW